MNFKIRMSSVLLVSSMLFSASGVWGAGPDDEMRKGVKLIASTEGPMAKRDLKGYCAATRGSPDYPGYLLRICQLYVKNNLKKPEDCTDASIKQEVAKDNANCLAMLPGDFNMEMATQREEWERILGQMREKGVDTDRLMNEERARIQ